MVLVDYHIHSHFSHDSESSIPHILATCREKGITSFVVTDHYEVSCKDIWKDWVFDVQDYTKEMKKNSLLVGVELGWDGVTPINLDLTQFDFVLLSHHDLDEPLDQQSYVKYLERLNNLIRKIDVFHSLAHLDFPRRYHKEKEAFSKDTYDLLREIFKYLVQKGKFLELNTRTISIYGEPNPDIEILNLYKSCGGEMLTLGSDAHDTNNIGMGIKEAIEILKNIGYKYIMIFDGTWKFKKI